MLQEYTRTELLVGEKVMEVLDKARVAVFGIGGAGSCAAEALARCGIGALTLVDYDTVSLTDINRQLIALHSTVGKPKTQVMKERINDIDPDILVNTYETFYTREIQQLFDFQSYDYVVDTMDILEAKLLLMEQVREAKVDIISCMDLSNKLNPFQLEIADYSKTSVCPMAKAVRTELRKKKIKKVKVLYSKEFPVKMDRIEANTAPEQPEYGRIGGQKQETGSIFFICGTAGMLIAGEVVRDIIRKKRQ